jgi:hypothetical protein
MQKKKNRRPRTLPTELPFGKPSWLTKRVLRWATTSLFTTAIALPWVPWVASQEEPIWVIAAFFLLLLAGVGVVSSWFSESNLGKNALDHKERALSSTAMTFIFAGFLGAWSNTSNLSFFFGLSVFALGLLLLFYVAASYVKAGVWLHKVWGHETPSWKIREERRLSGWDNLPSLVSNANNELCDTLLIHYEEDPGDDAPYRQTNKEVPYARVPFEEAMGKSLLKQATRVQVAKILGALLLLLPLFSRVSTMQTISKELCTTQGFIDLVETERGLFTMTQDGKLLLQRHNKAWNILPSQAPEDIKLTGIWGVHDSLFASAEDGIYHIDLTTGAWKTLYQSKTALNDIYGFEIPSGSVVLIGVGANGTVVRSMNGGANWSLQDLKISNSLYAVWGSLYGGFYVVGSEGLILYTNNSGADWSLQDSPVADAIVSVWGGEATGKLPGQIYAVSESGVILFSVHGSDSWNQFDNFFKLRPSGIFGTINTSSAESQESANAKIKDVYVIGQQGTIKRHNGFGWSPLDSGTGMTLWGGLVNEEGLFIVGNNGSLLFSDDNGESFTPLVSPFDALVRCSHL